MLKLKLMQAYEFTPAAKILALPVTIAKGLTDAIFTTYKQHKEHLTVSRL